jgi:uncharacterized cupin superfamily protein
VNTEILAKAADVELEDWGPLAEATGDPMTTHGLEMWVDGEKSAGIWQCTPGPSYWVRDENEVIFPTGWKGTWDIHETVRKVYSIF